jgi:anti-sigma factor RsiW
MNCEDVRMRIEDYHDGELRAEVEEQIAAHVMSCRECGRELELLRAEDRLYRAYAAGLDSQLASEQSMWERVRAAAGSRSTGQPGWIEAIRAVLSPRRLGYAALLVVLSVAGTLVAVRVISQRQAESIVVSGEGRDLESAMRSIARAEKEYEKAIRLLNDVVEKRKAALDPRLVVELERNLKAIDENIEATRRAFREHPSDPEYALYMLAAYARKVDLLQEVAS